MVYLAGRSQRGRARPLYCLVITLDRIRPGTAVGGKRLNKRAKKTDSLASFGKSQRFMTHHEKEYSFLTFFDFLNVNGSRSYYSPLKPGSPAPLHNPLHWLGPHGCSWAVPRRCKACAGVTGVCSRLCTATACQNMHGPRHLMIADARDHDNDKGPRDQAI
eukprot:scaffold15240_cov36-Phaeocystis_antarctica.AAC.1